jgi:MFS transporter, DHA1 family, solute carrier family 18 (vesicular amine transporter), member 1/2
VRRLTVTINSVVFLDTLLLFAIVPLLPEYARELDLGKTEAGLVVGAYSGAVLLCAVPAGQYADRIGPRRLTVAGVALLAVSTGAYAIADGFLALFLARAGQGVSSAVSWTAALSWLSAATPAERRGRALGGSVSVASAGALLGPVVGGAVGQALGIRAPFVLCAVVAALLVPAVWKLDEMRPDAAATGLVEAARSSLRNRLITAAVVIVSLAAVVSGALETLIPLELGEQGWSAIEIAAVFAVVGVIAIASNYAAGLLSDRIGRIPIAVIGAAAAAVAAALLALTTSAGALVAVYVASTPAISALYAVPFPLGTDGADEAGLGHGIVLGVMNLAWGAGFLAGPAVGAAVADVTSDAVTYVGLAAMSAGTGLWLHLALSRRECQQPA